MAVEFWSNNDRGYRIRLLIEEGNKYPSSNQSDVRYWLTLHSGSTSFAGYTINAVVVTEGQSLNYTGQPNVGLNDVITLIDRTLRVTHNSGGDKYVQATAQLTGSGGYSPGTLTIANVGLQLTTLQTASSISSTNAFLGEPVTITVNKKNSSYTHTIRYNWQGQLGTVVTGASGNVTHTPPLEFATYIPNNKEHAITYYCDTYNGNTLIGTTQSVSTLTVPSSMKPTIGSISLQETTPSLANISTSNTFVQVLSRVKAALNGVNGAYGSSISSYNIEVQNQNLLLNQNGGTFDFFKNSGTMTVRANITDSRGMTSDTITKEITVVPYSPPGGTFTAKRTGALSNIVVVNRSFKVSPIIIDGVQKNKLKLSFKFAKHNSDVFTNSQGNANEELTSTYELINSQASLAETFEPTTSYNIVAVISDNFFSNEVKATIGTITLPFTVTKNSIGLGKTPEIGNGIDSSWAYYYNNKPIQHYQLTNNDGTAILLTEGGDLNNITSPGCYNGSNLLNAPSNGWNYIRVTKHTYGNNFVLQEAIDFNGVVSAYRVKKNGSWGAWRYYAMRDELKNQTNTGWVSAGYTNSYYKLVGDILTIKYDFTGNGNSIVFATVPSSILVATQSYMWTVPKWSIPGNDNEHVQLSNGESSFRMLSTTNGTSYRGQITLTL